MLNDDEITDLGLPTSAADAISTSDDSPENFVVYASKGGTSKNFAEKIAAHLNFSSVINFASLSVNNLKKAKNVVFVVSTYGRGMPPPNANDAWEKIQAFSDKLPNLNFAVLGCGSSSFSATFAGFAKSIEEKLLSLGCKEIVPLCTRDEMEDDDDEKVDQWINDLSFK